MDPTVQVAIVTGLFSLVTVAVGKPISRRLSQIQEQVENSHPTNLRDDLDRVLAGVEELHNGLREQHQDLREMRLDLRAEREERVALEYRVDQDRREQQALAAQLREIAKQMSSLGG